ncbi:MAG: GC-type dockerin domain-anchored protein [Phycisphaerales bacterium]
MKYHGIAALALFALAGSTFASPRETQTVAGPFDVYGTDNFEPDARNASVTATFTATGYNAVGIRASIAVEYVDPFTYISDLTVRCIPPAGEPFDMVFSTLAGDYDTINNLTTTYPLPDDVTAVGTWQFIVWDSYNDSGGATPDATASNLRFSLDSDEAPATNHDFGTLNGSDATATVSDYVGGDVVWMKVTLPQDADNNTGFWMDLNTVGSATAEGYFTDANDTEMGLYRADGSIVDANDDIAYPASPQSALTFGATAVRDHGTAGFTYDGHDGVLVAGVYYIASGTYNLAFFDGAFNVDTASDSPGGSIVVNVFNNFPGAPAVCSPADLGAAGGVVGHDRMLNNNDFIAFISLFFSNDAGADLGTTGGTPGSDGAWNNNDFIAFINYFFNDAANCTG